MLLDLCDLKICSALNCFKVGFALSSLSLLLGGCASRTLDPQNEILRGHWKDVRPAIIFIPGYYGTALRRVSPAGSNAEPGARFFITASEFLFGSRALSLHTDDLLTPHAPILEPDGILESVPVIPYLYKVDVYGQFLADLKNVADREGQQLIPFAYDWRQDHLKSVGELAELVARLKKMGVPEITIMAHSMGGAISSYYIAYGNQEPETAVLNWAGAASVHRLILLAAPFDGVFAVFRNMQRGAVLGSNKSLLPAEAVASFPSSYMLLPMASASAVGAHHVSSLLPLEQIEFWKDHQLGLLRNLSVTAEVRQRRIKYVQEQITRSANITRLLRMEAAPAAELKVSDAKVEPPTDFKILAVQGQGRPTLARAFRFGKVGEPDEFLFDVDHPESRGLNISDIVADGDGTVTFASAQLPVAFRERATILHSTAAHDKIFAEQQFESVYPNFLK